MAPPVKTHLRAMIKNLALEGRTHKEIAAMSGTTYASVIHHIRVLASTGEIPRGLNRKPPSRSIESRKMELFRMRHGVRFGRMTDILTGLDDQQMEWLCENTPKGGTVADFVRSLIVDAFHEDIP